jgi:hypothetical protein
VSLATVLRQACDELGTSRATVNAPGAQDLQTAQLCALLLRTGQRLLSTFDWSSLITSGLVTTVAAQEAYAMPADFDRFVNDTQWNTGSRVPLFGPLNQPDWAQNEFGMINVGPFYRQQLRGKTLYLQPTPASVQPINFYYISDYWILQSGTTPGATLVADTDTFNLREDLLVAGLKWRWLRAKRLAFDEERDEYDRMLIAAQAQDRGARELAMDPAMEIDAPHYGFVVPLTGYGQ